MPSASKPKCVDGPRQQLTTGTEVRECLLRAESSVLMANASNSHRNRSGGMPIENKPMCVDGPRQQLTTEREARECY